MKKLLVFTIVLFVVSFGFSQKMMTRSGEVKFEASMPAFEEIAGTNSSVSCILDESTGEFVALVLVKAFKFKSPLMEEHFNENYMESTKFPKATFKGKINNLDASKLSSKPVAYDLDGDLTIHGLTKKVKTKINLALNAGKISAKSLILVKPQDYGVEIPNLVKGKIAENAKVSINFILEAK